MATNAANRLVRNVAWLGGLLVAVAIATGYIAVQFSPVWGAVAFAGTIGLAYALAGNNDELSISWALSAIAIGGLLIAYFAPEFAVDAISSRTITWPPDPWKLAVLVAATIAVWWVIDIRLISRSGVKPDTVAKRFRSRAEGLAESWFTIFAVAFGATLTIGVLLLNTFVGPVIGELADLFTMAPYAVADVATILLGYLALGGDVPILNGIPFLSEVGATGWVFLAGAILLLAVGVDFSDD